MQLNNSNVVPTMKGPATYRIRVRGRLDADWSDRLGRHYLMAPWRRLRPPVWTPEGLDSFLIGFPRNGLGHRDFVRGFQIGCSP